MILMLVTKTSSARECTSLYNIITQHKHYIYCRSFRFHFFFILPIWNMAMKRFFFLLLKKRKTANHAGRRIVSRRSPTHDFLHNVRYIYFLFNPEKYYYKLEAFHHDLSAVTKRDSRVSGFFFRSNNISVAWGTSIYIGNRSKIRNLFKKNSIYQFFSWFFVTDKKFKIKGVVFLYIYG